MMMRLGVPVLAAIVLCACNGNAPTDAAREAGERMYREGILVSGKPMTALVGGDIPVVGTQFSCENCHGRSGMGAAEGPYVVPPVAGQFLFAPSPQPERDAYNRESLARVLRDGVTPSGRVLLPELMPRYVLGTDDVDALATYLAELSAGNSPGVDDAVIRFATVIAGDADRDDATAMLDVLRRFAEDINRQTRNESGRWDRGYTPESKLPTVFRDWVIDEWVLEGEAQTWPEQLEAYYREAPVFAIAGGMGNGPWKPVAEFCESNKVPCLYPSTDLPWHQTGDFYTLYFSAGLFLEARLMAASLAERGVSSVVQVYCDPDHELAANALQEAATSVSVHNVSYDCARPLPLEHLQSLVGPDSAVVLWLDEDQVAGLPETVPGSAIYLSSTLAGTTPPGVLANGRELFVAHPYRLPGRLDPALRRFELWARSRNVTITAPRLQAETYFACLVLKDAVKHMGRFFIREFALDMLDHAESLAAYMPVYEQPSFGPGQRFISKGGYVLPVIDGRLVTEDALWIVP